MKFLSVVNVVDIESAVDGTDDRLDGSDINIAVNADSEHVGSFGSEQLDIGARLCVGSGADGVLIVIDEFEIWRNKFKMILFVTKKD